MRFALFLTLFLGCASLSNAGLFSDEEAHRKIAALQQQIQGMEERVVQMENTARSQGVGLLSQLDALRSELTALRGQLEVHAHDIEATQKRQRDLYVDLDSRLRKLEQTGGTSGQTDSSKPASSEQAPIASTVVADESKAYDAALGLFRESNYRGAIESFQAFVGAHPNSQFAPSAYYWIGNSYFNLRDYKNAIASQQKLISQYPNSPKVPDALLNIASSQQSLGDTAAARKTLGSIIATYPTSTAAETAKKRLAGKK